MDKTVPTRVMREHPDLDQIKRQAKELLDAFLAVETRVVNQVAAYCRDADPAAFSLHDAQLVLARAYGFQSWPKLMTYVDGVTASNFKAAVLRRQLAAKQTVRSCGSACKSDCDGRCRREARCAR